MDCKTFQHRLAELGPDARNGADSDAIDRHLAGCPRCRELDTLVRGELDVAPAEPPLDLAAAVLAKTTGRACDQARARLCDHVDGALAGLDARLVGGHVDRCADCAATASALVRLGEDLPALARLDPGPAFTERVLARTLPLHERLSRRRAALAEAWSRMLRRPRFGLEASYVGALALWGIFGLSGDALSDVPERALAVLEHGPTNAITATGDAVTDLRQSLTAAGRRTSEDVARQGGLVLERWSSEWNRRYELTAESREALRRHGGELGRAALHLDVDQSARAVVGLGHGLGRLWRDLSIRPETEPTDTELPARSPEC